MNITKARLKQIIKEEIQRVVSEADYTTRTVSGAEAAAMDAFQSGPEVRGHSQARRDAYRAARREEDIMMGAEKLLDQMGSSRLNKIIPGTRMVLRNSPEALEPELAKLQADPGDEMATAIRMKAAEIAGGYYPDVEYSDWQE